MKPLSIYLGVLFALINNLCISQNSYSLSITNTDSQPIFKKLTYKKTFSNLSFLNKELNKVYISLINEGYIVASVDSLNHDSLKYTAFLTIGKKYKWVALSYEKKETAIISKLGYNERFFANRPFKFGEVSHVMEKIVTHYENNGYPFASVKLDSLELASENIKAKVVVEKNVLVKLDSLITQGTANVKQKFLLRYLGIKNGMPYSEATFASVSKKIKQLPFVTEKTLPVMRLTNKQNKLYLFLDKKNASQFDGIVGILPSDKGKTIFTGDVKIKLVNTLFKSGETFDINWRRLQTQTQDLKAQVIYPYMFGLPFGIDYNIKIYKKDSSFIDINNAFGLNYYYSGLNFVKVFYKQRNANLISTAALANATVLPDYADVTTKSYGVALGIEKMDYKFNPHKGYSISIQGSLGNRQIRKNPKVNDAAYSLLALKTSQYQTDGYIAGYINLRKNHVLKIAMQFGSVFGNTIYKNELYRIGGLRTLRGFDEESIYASSYIIPTVEYRFLFEKNSNLFLFAEGAWYENKSSQAFITDTPMSIGAGINFETKAGIFNLSYGIGKQSNSAFDLRTGKIHAGLSALF